MADWAERGLNTCASLTFLKIVLGKVAHWDFILIKATSSAKHDISVKNICTAYFVLSLQRLIHNCILRMNRRLKEVLPRTGAHFVMQVLAT